MIKVTETRAMRVILLTSSYPSSSNVANRNFLTDLADSLNSRNIRVFVICPHKPGLPFLEKLNDVTIIRFAYWFPLSGERLGRTGGITATITQSPIAALQMIPFCICQLLITLKTIRKEKIDLIHSHWIVPQGIIGGIIKFITNIPHVSSIHGTDIHLVHSSRFIQPIIKITSKYADYITTNSSHTNRIFCDIIPSRKKNIQIIPMGIYIDEFRSNILKPKTSEKNILFVGRLIMWKGVQHLIKALEITKKSGYPVQLVIIGDGPYRKELRELSIQLQVTSVVKFLQNQDQRTLLSYYHNADIFVLPSITYQNQTEGLGVVLLEAMASGIPVIGSNTGGIPDIIDNDVNGILVPPGDAYALAEAIIKIIDNPEIAERYKIAGLKTVKERFSWDTIAEEFIHIYHELV